MTPIYALGAYAPYLLVVLTVALLLSKSTYLCFMVFGLILSNVVNILLKWILQEPKIGRAHV